MGKILQSLIKKPNNFEYRWIRIFNNHNLPYKYVGNGQFILGGKCPDFIHTNGKKKCIETRSKAITKIFDKISPEEYELKRKEHFKQYGWDCEIIWGE